MTGIGNSKAIIIDKRKRSGYIDFRDKTNNIKSVGYTRLSSVEKDSRDTLNRHIQQLQLAGCTEVYWDIISRSTKKRDGLSKVIELIKNKEILEIVLIRLDRLTDSHELMEEFIELVIQSGVKCRALYDSIDLTTVGGRTHARLLVTLSRNEIERTRERYINGWEGVRRKEKAINPPYGYITEDGIHKFDKTEVVCLLENKRAYSKSELAREYIEAFLETRSIRKAAREVNTKFGVDALSFKQGVRGIFIVHTWLGKLLVSPVLRGHIVYFRGKDKELVIEDKHTDILISDSEYKEIQHLISYSRKHRGYIGRAVHPLTGLLYCKECNRGLVIHVVTKNVNSREGKQNKKYVYYYCANGEIGLCKSKKGIKYEDIEEGIIAKLVEESRKISSNIQIIEKDKEEDSLLKERRDKLERLKEFDDIEIIELRKKIEREIELIVKGSSKNNDLISKRRELLLEAFSNRDFILSKSDEIKKGIYRRVIDKVIVGINNKKQVDVDVIISIT